MTRVDNWVLRYAEFMSERQSAPFVWGSNDCCLFAADCVQAITGTDLAAAWRGQYSSALQAARFLEEGGGLEAVATQALGTPVLPSYASVGDVVLFENAGRLLLGICNGELAFGPGAAGVEPLDMSTALKAWKV